MKEEKAPEADWSKQMVEDIAAKVTSHNAIILSDEDTQIEIRREGATSSEQFATSIQKRIHRISTTQLSYSWRGGQANT